MRDPLDRYGDDLQELLATPRVWGLGGPEDATAGLIDLCRDWVRPDAVVCEVGCFAGVSTSVFACFAREVIAVEPWGLTDPADYGAVSRDQLRRAEDRFRAHVLPRYPHVRLIHALSVAAAEQVPNGALDLVYLDGDHSFKGFGEDVRAWVPKLKPGGVLAGHDFGLVAPYFDTLRLPPPARVYAESSWAIGDVHNTIRGAT